MHWCVTVYFCKESDSIYEVAKLCGYLSQFTVLTFCGILFLLGTILQSIFIAPMVLVLIFFFLLCDGPSPFLADLNSHHYLPSNMANIWVFNVEALQRPSCNIVMAFSSSHANWNSTPWSKIGNPQPKTIAYLKIHIREEVLLHRDHCADSLHWPKITDCLSKSNQHVLKN